MDELILFGSEVKTRADGTVEGYLVLFGTGEEADFDGDYFTKTTDFDLNWDELGLATVYFNHGLDPVIGKAKLCGGQKATLKLTDDGVWIEAKLKEAEIYDQMVLKLLKKRRVGWSSGVPAHLVEKERVGKANHIKKWPLGSDASITHTPNDWRNVATLKSLADALTESDGTIEDAVQVTEDAANASSTDNASINLQPGLDAIPREQPDPHQETNMDMELVAQVAGTAIGAYVKSTGIKLADDEEQQVTEAASAELAKMVDEDKPEDMPEEMPDEEERMMKAVTSAAFTAALGKVVNEVRAVKNSAIANAIASHVATAAPQSKVGGFAAPAAKSAGRIELRTKYADLSAGDMAYLHMVRKAVSRERDDYNYVPDIEFVREAFDKAQKAYGDGKLLLDPKEDASTIKSLNAFKANELDHSTQSGFGDEWVPNVWSADLWLRSRLDNVVFSRIRSVDMPSNPFELPVETTDPTVYKVAEATAETELTLDTSSSLIPDSKVATTKVTLTAAKLGLRVGISSEVEEDSIIPFIANARRQALRALMDSIDNVILNGDTATTLNVNSDGESISDATRKYLVFNGIIKNAIVTNTTNAVNGAGAAPTLAKLRETRGKLLAAKAARVDELAWFVDFSTYLKLLAIDEVSSAANRGSVPTGVTGVLGGIDGINLFVSAEMALADTDGKVTQTVNVTDTGRAVLVHLPSWIAGYRRRVQSSMIFHPEYDSYQMVATVRLALQVQDTDSAAVLYNIGI